MKRHPTRPTLVDVERNGQSFFITIVTPDGKTRREVYGFWENTDNRAYVITGSSVNAAGGKDHGNYDLYVRHRRGERYQVEMWTDQIKKFMDLLETTRYIRGTATGASWTDDSITLEYVNPDGQPDTFTFELTPLVRKWSFWVYKSRSFDANTKPEQRYLMAPLAISYTADLHVPDEDVYTLLNDLLGLSGKASWMRVGEDEAKKFEAAAPSYAFLYAA